MAFETGRNSWESYEAWPPHDGIEQRKLNFAANSKLTFDTQRDETSFDSYVSDPAKPVPYIPRPVHIGGETTAALRRAPERAVLVNGDQAANYGRVVQAMVILQQAGAKKVGFQTDPPPRSATHP